MHHIVAAAADQRRCRCNNNNNQEETSNTESVRERGERERWKGGDGYRAMIQCFLSLPLLLCVRLSPPLSPSLALRQRRIIVTIPPSLHCLISFSLSFVAIIIIRSPFSSSKSFKPTLTIIIHSDHALAVAPEPEILPGKHPKVSSGGETEQQV